MGFLPEGRTIGAAVAGVVVLAATLFALLGPSAARRSLFASTNTAAAAPGGAPKSGDADYARIYDCFIFHSEMDLLEVRIAELYNVVDTFVLVEATKTLSGEPKPLVYDTLKHTLPKKFRDKVHHVVIRKFAPLVARLETWSEFQPERLRYQRYAKNWRREAAQRLAIQDALTELSIRPGDLVHLSDVDELPHYRLFEPFRRSKTYRRGRWFLPQRPTPFPYSIPLTTFTYNFLTLVQDVTAYTSLFQYTGSNLEKISRNSIGVKTQHHPKHLFYPFSPIFNGTYKQVEGGGPTKPVSLNGWHCSSCFPSLEDYQVKYSSFSHGEQNTGFNRTLAFFQERICAGETVLRFMKQKLRRLETKEDLATYAPPRYVTQNAKRLRYLYPLDGRCALPKHSPVLVKTRVLNQKAEAERSKEK